VVRAKPDGNTIILASNSEIVLARHFNNAIAYDGTKDLRPVTLVGHAHGAGRRSQGASHLDRGHARAPRPRLVLTPLRPPALARPCTLPVKC
jgi:hypothetical protein